MRLKTFFLAFYLVIYFVLLFVSSAYFQPSKLAFTGKYIEEIEQKYNAKIGVGVLNTENRSLWDYRGSERFPLVSTFKTIACAKLLKDSELSPTLLEETVVVSEMDIIQHSPVLEKHIGAVVNLEKACMAMMKTSDNTAANIVVNSAGGTIEITHFLKQIGDDETRLDRLEPLLNEARPGDHRDTTTPISITKTLDKLLFGNVLSESNQKNLLHWMKENQVSGNLIRKILPEGYDIADRSGLGGFGTRAINAIIWRENQKPIIISIYITQTKENIETLDLIITQVGNSIISALDA